MNCPPLAGQETERGKIGGEQEKRPIGFRKKIVASSGGWAATDLKESCAREDVHPLAVLVPGEVEVVFELVEGELRRLAPARSQTETAKAAQALWSGVHGVCILGLTERLGIFGAESLEELVESLIVNYLVGFSRH